MINKLPFSTLKGVAEWTVRLCIYLIPTKTIQYAKLNIKIALSHLSVAEQKQIARQALINEATSYLEFMHIWNHSPEQNIAMIHRITGEQYFQDAIKAGKGLVLVVPHFGSWEVMNAWISAQTEVTIMYKPLKNTDIDDFVLAARSREGANLVPTDETGVKQVFRALKRGGTTAILPDHSPDHPVEMHNWFDVPLYSSQLSAKLIQKTGAAALLMYAIRNEASGFDVYIDPLPDQIYDPQANGTQLIFDRLQDLILDYPQHYHWSYKRFKANPETTDLYTVSHAKALKLIQPLQAQTRKSRQ